MQLAHVWRVRTEDAVAVNVDPSPPLTRVPLALWAAVAVILVTTALYFAGLWGHRDQLIGTIIAFTIKLLIEAAAVYWASRRRELPSAFRKALRLLAAVSLVSAGSLWLTPLGRIWPVLAVVNTAWYAASYLIAAFALAFIYPRHSLRRGAWFALVADCLITAVSLSVLQWLSVQAALADPSLPAANRMFVTVSAPIPILFLLGLTVIGVAGREIPSRRAFWWLFAGAGMYLPLLLARQFAAYGMPLDPVVRLGYVLGVLPTLRAAWLVRRDAWLLTSSSQRSQEGELRLWNPLPALSTLALGAMTAITLVQGKTQDALLVGLTLVFVTLLVVVRVMVTSHENQRLLAERAESEARAEQERMAAVGRLAGGIAHEFNSLMTAVIGHAELGALSLPEGSQLRNDLGRIRQAGDRAAALAARLLHFSGRQMHRPVPLMLSAHVHSLEPLLRAELPAGITLDLKTDDVPAVKADPTQVGIALNQLAANAIAAMPNGGTMRVRVRPVHLEEPLQGAVIPVVAGDYVALEVTDTGTGIAPEHLAHVFEPFFTTQPIHAAAGLGLAAVHGIMSAHEGGITLDSTVGLGTTVRLLWPSPRRLGPS